MDIFASSDVLPYIKTTTRTVPYGKVTTYTVLPTDEKGELPKGKKGRFTPGLSDDNTYLHHPDLIDMVPRGFSVLIWHDRTTTTLRGFSKFDGTTPADEDEGDPSASKLIPSGYLQSWKNVRTTFQEKANGKMAIFMVVKKSGILYLFGGSKNVHAVHPLHEVISPDLTELHWCILALIQKDLLALPEEELPVGKVIVGEYEDGCHIVYRETPRMVYFNDMKPGPRDLLPAVDRLPTPDELQQIRTMTGIEGCVIVYTNKDTGETKRHKHKTVEYVMLRVIREAVANMNPEVGAAAMVEKVIDRFRKRSNAFLKLTDEELTQWGHTAFQFIEFVLKSRWSLKDLRFDSPIGMARIWHAFQTHAPVEEKKEAPVGIEDIVQDFKQIALVKSLVQNNVKTTVILRGCSGSGKSTVAKWLQQELKGAVFSTDSFFTVDGVYRFDPKKLQENHQKNLDAFLAYEGVLAVVDNTNLAQWEYQKYSNDRVPVVVNMRETDPATLAKRNQHNVPISSILKMAAKFTPVYPSYYGIFFSQAEYPPVNGTPLHVTCLFTGRKTHDADMMKERGETVIVTVTGLRVSQAGTCYEVQLPSWVPYKNSVPPHITLKVNKGYSPVDVGKMVGTVTPMNMVMSGVFGEYY